MRKRLPPLAKQFASKSFSKLTHHLSLWHQVVRDHTIMDHARNRIVIGIMAFAVGYLLIGLRLFDVMVLRSHSDRQKIYLEKQENLVLERSGITDRHGEILATHLITASVYANPKVLLNPRDAAEKLCALIPELDFETTLKRLQSAKGFVWIIRHISPKLQQAIHHLGIPGIYLQKDQRRVYPYGSMVSHVLGCCGIDNIGLSGIEKYCDHKLRQDKEPLVLSIDIRVQHAVYDLLKEALQEFSAIAANAMVLDLPSGQLLAMVSLPDFDPNQPSQAAREAIFNRNTLGVYEPGSVLKIFNTAIALETGRIKLSSVYDASQPIKVGRFTIKDFKGQNRPLTLQEAFIHSSNIAFSKMAMDFGLAWQQKYFARFGLLSKPKLEIPEMGAPIVNSRPTEATLISNSFGYAISISPFQTFRGVAAIMNDGQFRELTLLKQKMPVLGEPIVTKKTADQVKKLMRLVILEGTGRKANVEGYPVLGKTGTAYKQKGRGYTDAKTTTFIGAFPAYAPRYLILVMLDSPKPTPKTHGYSTGGWTACPTAGKMIARIAPMLGLSPNFDYNDDMLSNIQMVSHNVADISD